MDGGISRIWAHTDVVAGSKRAIVITLTNGYEGSLLSGILHNIYDEMKNLQATGTKGRRSRRGVSRAKIIRTSRRAGFGLFGRATL